MKKAKLFLTAIIMTLASALITACSCTDVEFTPVPETGISIECTTVSDDVNYSLDEESGNLTISCYKGDRFTIRYTLTPSNTTETQVDWAFTKPGILTCSTMSYSKGTVESISFTAYGKGETDIVFTTKTTGKMVKASITVYEEKAKLTALPKPSNFAYDSETHTVSWGNITEKGIVAYELYVLERKIDNTGASYIDTSVEPIKTEVTTNSYSGFEAGKTYGIKVTAIGDDKNAVTGEQSQEFIFHQLADVTIDEVVNGKVYLTTPNYSNKVAVACDGVSDVWSKDQVGGSVNDLGGVSYNLDCSYFGDGNSLKYDLSAIAYPKGYIDGKQDKAQNGVYYYPSKAVSVPTITKLSTPTLALKNISGTETINGVTFNTVSATTKLNLQGINSYNSKLNAKYQYFFFNKEQIDGDEESALNNISVDDNNKEVTFGGSTVKVFITNDAQMSLSSSSCYVYARMVGDVSTTIGSGWEKIRYKQLGRVMSSGGTDDDIKNISISQNIVRVDVSSGYMERVEFYFVNTENSDNSRVVSASDENICEYNIASLNLASGSYNVYAKLIGKETSGDDLIGGLTGSLYTGEPIATVKVLKSIEELKMTSGGTVSFKGVSYMADGGKSVDIGNYTFTLVLEKRNGDTYSYTMPLNVNAIFSETKDGDTYVTPLTKNGAYYSFDLYDVMRAVRAGDGSVLPSNVPDSDVYGLLSDYVNYKITIIANSNSEGEEAIISSKASAEMKFGRVASVDEITLKDKQKLEFGGVIGATGYVVEIDGVTSAVYSSSSTGTITIDLSGLKTANGDKTMLDIVDKTKESVEIYVYGVGREATTTDNQGMINSFKTQVHFGFSGTPESLSMNANGELEWIASANINADTSYVVTFYNANATKLTTKTVTYNSGENVEDDDKRKYTLDVSSILANYEGQEIYMVITENQPEAFALADSTKFYAMKLTTTNARRELSSGKKLISWDSVENAMGYVITCDKLIFDGNEEKVNEIKLTSTSYELPSDMAEGTYTFTIVAYTTNDENSGHTEGAPYIISSSATQTGGNNPTTSVIVTNGQTTAIARGENVVWSYNSDYVYGVSYRLVNGEWIEIADDDITTTEGRKEKSFSLSAVSAGSYEVKIVSSVDYVEKGVILAGSERVTAIDKLETVTDVTAKGRLQFKLPEALREGELTFEICNNGVAMDSSLYSISAGEVCYVDFKNIPSGTMKITIRVKATGKIDSNYTTEYSVTKIENVSEFERAGDYLKWAPVTNATYYEILVDGTEKKYTLKAEPLSEGGYTCQIIADDGSASIDETTFKYEDGVLVFMPDNLVAGAHTYSISAKTELTGYINGSSNSISVTKLHNVVDVSVGLGVFEYGYYEVKDGEESPIKVEIKIYRLKEKTASSEEEGEPAPTSENGYEIDEACTPIVREIPFAEYSSLATSDGGKYSINIFGLENYTAKAQYGTKIRFIGNDANILTSDETALYTAPKIAPVRIYTENGMLAWDGLSGATYSVEISNDTGVIVTFDVTSTDDSVTLPASLCDGIDGISNLSGVGVDGGESGDDEGDIEIQSVGGTFDYVAGEEYSIRVSAKVSGNLMSEWSETFRFRKLLAMESLNMTVENKKPVLYWTNPNNKTYKFSIALGYYDVTDQSKGITAGDAYHDTLYRELSYDLPVGEYYIRMQAKGNTSNSYGLLTSDVSEISNKCKVTYIANETTPKVESGILTWNSFASEDYPYGAYSYEVKFTNDELTYITYTSTNYLDLNSSDVPAGIKSVSGYWNIQVRALTDPQIAMISTHKDTEATDTTTTYRPGELKDFKIKDGKLSWTISYEEINTYMQEIAQPEIGGSEGDDEESEIAVASETGEEYAWADASTIIPYIKDKAVTGKSSEILYDKINLEHYLKVNLSIDGIISAISPTEARTINDKGETVEDKSGTKIEFCYDVDISSNNGGLYEFSITPYGYENVLDGVTSGTLSAYKLATPTSWYDEVETSEPVLDEDGNPVLDENGEPTFNTTKVKTDIINGKALWQLITTNNGTEYYKKYTLTASLDGEGSSSSVKVVVAENDENIKSDYKYSRDLKELFYNDDNKENKIQPDTIYKLFLQANGTEDSSTDASGKYYLNSNKYTFGDTMTILKECETNVEDGNYLWNPNNNSISSKLVIYGPLNYKDANPNGTLDEEEKAAEWYESVDTLTMLAKIMYANTGDESVFEKYGISNASDLIGEVDGNVTTYLDFVKTVTFSIEDGTKSSQYTLTDKDYKKGGYAIFEQEIGNHKGIIDSPMSEVEFAYKLGTTSATRTIDKTKNSETKSVDYWLGSGDTAGMFTWNAVPRANAYRLTLYGIDTTQEGAQKTLLEENIIVYGRTYYDLNETRDYGNTNFEYSLDIVAVRMEDTHGGSESTPNYSMVAGYFASDNVGTDKEFVFDNGESIVTGRYRRIDMPVDLQIDDKGVIEWDGGSTKDFIYEYLVSYSWGTGQKITADNTSNEPKITVLNTILGTTTIRVRAIAMGDEEYLNSCYSDNLNVTKIAPPEPTVSEGVFGWGTEGDQSVGQSVTSSNLKFDGTEISLDSNKVLEYMYFTDVDESNYEKYSSSDDENKFTVGNHTISIKYNGTSGSSKDNKNFYIASEEKLYYVTKLATPTLAHYTKEGNNAVIDGGNKVYWNFDEYAKAYKLKFFVKLTSTDIKVYTYIINMNDLSVTFIHPDKKDSQTISKDYFKIEGESGNKIIIFNMEHLLGGSGVASESSEKGLNITAFVQAVGTLASSSESENSADNRDYLSSSYSDGLPVSIPSAPKDVSYNPSGKLTWSLTTASDANKPYNILLVAEYMIENVSGDVQLKWLKTAEKTGYNTTNFLSANTNSEQDYIGTRGSDIIGRIVLSKDNGDGTYTIYVQDTILVKSVDGKMPLSYNVTAVAKYTSFKLTTTAYEDAEDGVYKSTTLTYTSDSMSFALFNSGNGTSLLPYDVSSETQLNDIRTYSSSYYIITKDISLSNKWTIIDKFSGNIDGGNYLISNVIADTKADAEKSYISFINENNGTVKNLKLQINYSTVSDAKEYWVAGLAIENKGIIDNVHIVPLLKTANNATDYTNSTKSIISVKATCGCAYVGGLVVNNYGTISNSSVLADIEALVNKASNATTTTSVVGRVGGIAWRLTGSSSATIVNSCFKSEMNGTTLFSGSITANFIGGIVEMCDVEATISKCHVDKGVELTLTDKTAGDSNYKTSGNLGGIVATATKGITIDTCYSLATIKVDIAGTSGSGKFTLGGILAVYDSDSDVEIKDCYAVIECIKVTNNTAVIKLYGITISGDDNVKVTNCYYVEVNAGDNTISIDTSSAGTSITLNDLKSKVSSDKYDTTGTYPTIKSASEETSED